MSQQYTLVLQTGKSEKFKRTIHNDPAILAGYRERLKLSIYHASDVPFELAGKYAILHAKTKSRFPGALRDARMDEVFGEDNLVVTLESPSGLEAGSYAKRIPGENNGNTLELCGFCSSGNYSRTAIRMIAGLTLAEQHTSGVTPDGQATVRKHKCGSLNLASAIPFGQMGFEGEGTSLVPVTLADVHMYDEFIFLNGKPHIQSHRMFGEAERIEPRAWDALADWSLSFGKSRIEEEGTIFFGKERGHG